MFERMTTLITGLRYVWKYSGPLNSALKHIATYPGVASSGALRAWLRPVVLDLSLLTAMTKNTIDDKVAMAAIHIIDCDQAWDAVYDLAILAHDDAKRDGVKIPLDEMNSSATENLFEIADAVPVENPAIVIAAIGLIIQLVQLLKR